MNSKFSFNMLGMLAFAVFTIFTLTAVLFYPTFYNPLYEWLSNLGNVNLNPSGALFFNLGCIITALILIPFFITLRRWDPTGRWSKILVIIGVLLGIFASISLIGVGVFPETNIQMHTIAASGVFGSLFIIIILLNIALFKHPKFMHGVTYWGILAVLITFSFQVMLLMPQNKDTLATFHPTLPLPGMEWAAVFSSLIWVGLLSYNMWKKDI